MVLSRGMDKKGVMATHRVVVITSDHKLLDLPILTKTNYSLT